MVGLVRITKGVIVRMTNKLLILIMTTAMLSGCVGKADHPQCQKLKSEAYGAQWGAALTGRYVDQITANIDDRQYERCEQMFDLVQYQEQQQIQMQAQQRAKEQELEQARAQMRKVALDEKMKSPEIQEKLRSTSLKDLVDCEKHVRSDNDKVAPDIGVAVSHACEMEIDRRVDTGMVSRSKVNKM